MKYKVGNKVVSSQSGNIYKIIKVDCEFYYFSDKHVLTDDDINHEETKKLNCVTPKSYLKDSFKVKFENHRCHWYLSALNRAFSDIGGGFIDLNDYDDDLRQNCQVTNRLLGWDIMEIYDTTSTLVWKREKSPAQIEKEAIEKELEEMSKKSAELKERLKNIK